MFRNIGFFESGCGRCSWRLHKTTENFLKVSHRQCLGENVCKVGAARNMSDGKLALAYAVAEPVETHVDCFGTALFACVVGEVNGKFVVAEDGRGGLCVAESDGDVADVDTLLTGFECGTVLGFGGGADDHIEDCGIGEDSSVFGGGYGGVSEVNDASRDGFAVGAGEVRCVCLNDDVHVGFTEDKFRVGVGSGILEQATDGWFDSLRGCCLYRPELVNFVEKRGVHCATII